MKKILVIEDDTCIRNNLMELLTALEFFPIAAENGLVGVQLARSQRPDLILCDLIMPELDGYGVLSVLQQDPTTATIPFIGLTACQERSHRRQVMELGASDYLSKPFTHSELTGAIKAQLGKQQKLQQRQALAIQEAISQLNDLVYYDSLTNLPNRLLLRERFDQALAPGVWATHLLPVLVLSLDQLNRLHQSLGPDYSDLLLQAVSEPILPFILMMAPTLTVC